MSATYNKTLANWLTNNFMSICKKYNLTPATSGIDSVDFGILVSLLYKEIITRKQLEKILIDRMEELHHDKTT
jgi:Asp-tRNA(Asn)/Glu-tRNA(Gln) amidotransferase B subunit